jgi:ABC-2 type transport system permease protein
MTTAWQAWAIGWRRERKLLRERPLDLAMLTWVPLLAMLLTWSLFAAGMPRGLPVAVLDADHSSLSRQLVRLLRASPGLTVVAMPADEATAQQLMRTGEVYAVVVVPEDLARSVKLHNAQFATHSGLIQRDVRTVLGTLSAGIELTVREKRGESVLGARAALEPMRTALVSVHNPGLDYEQFLATALVPTLLHIFAMVAGAWMVGRELRDGRIATLWALTQRAAPALLAKLALPLVALVCIDALFFVGLSAGRGWAAAGPLWPVLGLHALMLALYVVLGAFAALVSRSLRTALSAAGFITAPAFAYAGVAFPLMAMPLAARSWALALPITHVLAAQSDVLQAGASATALWPLVAALHLA